MRTTPLRKSTLALGAAPVLAQGDGDDTRQNTLDARMFNNAQSFSATTTYYPAPAYVTVPAPAQTATTSTTTTPGGAVMAFRWSSSSPWRISSTVAGDLSERSKRTARN